MAPITAGRTSAEAFRTEITRAAGNRRLAGAVAQRLGMNLAPDAERRN